MSIHIGAKEGEIADVVLLPGDPLRAQEIAQRFLDDPVCYNRVRNMLGFTGTWRGMRVSVQGTGMGIPSISIYVEELIREYGAKILMRVGTCGSLQRDVGLYHLVLAQSASSDSNVNRRRFRGLDFAPWADFDLLSTAFQVARERGLPVHVGGVISSDTFYQPDPEEWKLWARYGVMAVEMEASGLYTIALREGVKALTLLTVSDSLVTGDLTSAEEREKGMLSMVEVALETASRVREAL
ncbi:purine-nucleoside phosphorylase [Spirochaeta thermophila]|uniref:Uridine phosphorylase n=1 Tax=Winmispira thermophila (strain ATCC 49972 / DSM 6192 / RI 19.B1) TaxID=665571 RepID=E0RRP6_WINT6|nr:purine-nucleoside phosphorylase [Spirochaeta thermophila]ADN03150.1 purine nucleoside phosphorylase deoD-type [Spirochaeta thermophila DSM 6192]